MKKVLVPLTLATGLALASAASAATVSPSVTSWIPGTGVGTDPTRYDMGNVNDGDSSTFLSLGKKGSALFNVAYGFTGPVTISEVTYSLVNYYESANVYAATSYNGTDLTGFTLLGSITNADGQGDGAVVAASGIYYWLAIVDTTPRSSRSTDGFDISTVTVSPVPLPAAAPLMAGGLAGLGFFGRRRRAKKAAAKA